MVKGPVVEMVRSHFERVSFILNKRSPASETNCVKTSWTHVRNEPGSLWSTYPRMVCNSAMVKGEGLPCSVSHGSHRSGESTSLCIGVNRC